MIDFFVHSFNTLSHGLLGYVVPFLFVLTIVVFFHELGHFLVARWAGVKVLTFSLGFGPELVGFNDRHGTRWKISAIPLGGYVKFFGDESEASTPASAEALASMTEEERAGSFHHKKVGARAAIVAAGPIANFILAIVIFTCLFTFFGKPSTTARVDKIEASSAAERAGFQVGNIFTGRASADQIGGPIRIAQISGQVATLGLIPLLHLAAVLSISIGLLNLFPVPLLDGGHLLFYTAEVLRGRPLSEKSQEYGFRVGLVLVLMLMVFAFYNDFHQVPWLKGLFGRS